MTVFSQEGADVFAPDGIELPQAFGRITHMGVGAHQDDLEIMAAAGILACFGDPEQHFAGVTVTNGDGSPRDGLYKDYTDEMMKGVRRREQRKTAYVGEYGLMVQLNHPSSNVKDPSCETVVDDLRVLIRECWPRHLTTHNLFDKHDTHVAIALRLVAVLRAMPAEFWPETFIGAEVWRSLDMLIDADQVSMDVSGHPNLQAALLGAFDSQVCGGKRYDLATMGRRQANATFWDARGVDTMTGRAIGMDLRPLLTDCSLDPADYALEYLDRLAEEVKGRIDKHS